MNGQQLRDRMADLVRDQPPMRHDSADDLRRGRRRLFLYRGSMAAAATAAAVAAVIVVTTAVSGGPTDNADSFVAPAPDRVTIFEQCNQAGHMGPEFGPGSRVLASDTSPDGQVSAVVLSADGQAWADCLLADRADPSTDATTSTYPINPHLAPRWGTNINTMALGPDYISYLDRFTPNVAHVELRFPGGPTLSADTVQGFVVFERQAAGIDANFPLITLYGGNGKVLAHGSTAPGDAPLPSAYRTLVPIPPWDPEPPNGSRI